ncbi:hypothetical protein [Streptomyces sp. NPDC023327]|uniref:hypothetical protein n=1 Tax=Streptomyces sp. NPDC023327 TaxID=3157088 RepID=UPI0033D4A0B7
MSMRNRNGIKMRAAQAAVGALTAVAVTAGIPATAHASEGADLSVIDGEVTDPALFAEFDADVEDGTLEEAADGSEAPAMLRSSGVWKRYSWKCKSPGGAKFNISIGYRGPASQTIYFNNHCNQKRSVRTHYKGQAPGGEPSKGSYCAMTVNPKTKGKKKHMPSNYFPWYKATSNC